MAAAIPTTHICATVSKRLAEGFVASLTKAGTIRTSSIPGLLPVFVCAQNLNNTEAIANSANVNANAMNLAALHAMQLLMYCMQ